MGVLALSSLVLAASLAGQGAEQARLPCLWIIGDSTVRNGGGKGDNGQWGWGDRIGSHFDLTKIQIMNRAIGGRSSRTFLTDGRWDAVLAEAKPGDFLLVQFGHNDPAAVNDDSRARGTIPGIGEETLEIDNLLTKKKETVHSFGWYLRKYVREATEKGMHPILCTYVPRCPRPGQPWPVKSDPASYRLWAQQTAETTKAPCIDLYGLAEQAYLTLRQDEIKSKYFCEADFTHTNLEGAELNASLVVKGIRGIPDHALKGFLLTE